MPKDEAGPLWLLLEDFLESWPIKPMWVLLAGLIVCLIVAVVAFLASKRRKS
jgi:LPXTG-motif cell wall-anchored protein